MNESTNTTLLNLSPNPGKVRYMPGLDGLRALSVLAVIAYHLKLSWAPGGLLGVGIFFTLSGYLITDQLLTEWHNTGRLNLKYFWIRRMRRLLPAMFLMLAAVACWLYFADHSRLISLKGAFLSAIFYVNNWWLIFHKVSYFESFGAPSPIGHLWSLAIEEQFYILWPLFLTAILRWVPRRGRRVFIILMGAAASALAMALIYQPGTDPSRVYYGTDTRAFALLIGAALAMLIPSRTLATQRNKRSRAKLDNIAWLSLLGIILFVARTNQFDPAVYRFGLVIFTVLSAVVITALTHPDSRLSTVLGCKPLRWLGVRSYGVYLWHYPIIILTSPSIDTGSISAGRVILQVVLILVVAALSYKYIEEPIRRGHLKPWGNKISAWVLYKPRYALIIAIIPLLLLSMSGSIPFVDDKHRGASSAVAQEVPNKQLSAQVSPSPSHSGANKAVNTKITKPKPSVNEGDTAKPAVTEVRNGQGITAIGDSVMLDIAPELNKLLPGIVIDGKVGRQMNESQAVVDHLKAEGKLGNIVIIELGTNGPFSPKQLHSLIISLGDVKQVVLVNTRVPRVWQDIVNSDLEKVAAEFPNATLVDWFSASKGHDSFFTPDGVHLTPEGARYYAIMVSRAINKEG